MFVLEISLKLRKELIWINLWLGKYHILSILDSLSPAPHVFLASHVKLQAYRVIKKISKANPFFMQLKNEAKFLSKYSSEFIPKLYDVEEDNENLYLVEEYIQGISLSSSDFLKNKLKDSELASIVSGLFNFLKFINSLEEAVLYIDWKPGNIILTETGIKVVDFGSVLYSEDCSNFTGLATEGFAAPELIDGSKLGSYTDIYGFGSILKYLSERTEGKKSLFKRTAKERCMKLAAKCTKKNYNERPCIKEIERTVKGFNRKVSLSFMESEGIISSSNVSKIGVCGSANGVGTTHVAFCIAKDLIKQGKKVAYAAIENDGGCYTEFSTGSEALKGIRIYKNVCEEDLSYFLKKEFDSLILDFGKADEFSLAFHSCDEKLLVVQNNFVKGGELEKFLSNHCDDIGEKGWTILDNLSDKSQLEATKALVRKMGLKVRCKGMGIKRI